MTIRQKTPYEQTFSNAVKAARSAVRLFYSIKADEALNDILPALEEEYTQAILSGKPYELDVKSILERVDEDLY